MSLLQSIAAVFEKPAVVNVVLQGLNSERDLQLYICPLIYNATLDWAIPVLLEEVDTPVTTRTTCRALAVLESKKDYRNAQARALVVRYARRMRATQPMHDN